MDQTPPDSIQKRPSIDATHPLTLECPIAHRLCGRSPASFPQFPRRARQRVAARTRPPMVKEHNQLMVTLMGIADACAIALAWVISYWIRFNWLPIDQDKGVPDFFTSYLAMMPLVVLSHLVIFSLTGLYRP